METREITKKKVIFNEKEEELCDKVSDLLSELIQNLSSKDADDFLLDVLKCEGEESEDLQEWIDDNHIDSLDFFKAMYDFFICLYEII